MAEAWVWRDKNDKNQFWLGVKANSGFCGWVPVFCDAWSELFGKDTADKMHELIPGGEPVRVDLVLVKRF